VKSISKSIEVTVGFIDLIIRDLIIQTWREKIESKFIGLDCGVHSFTGFT
jgi:hypothetical protein